MPAIPGCASSALTASFAPWTRLSTPAGMPASCANSTISGGENGTCSLGFRIKVLPVALAYGQNQQDTIAGKLNGVTAANTPSGWREETQSMPAAPPPMVLPILDCGSPQS